MVDTESESKRSGTARRKRDVRWKVVANVQPQCSERVRWVQLVWASEPISEWWPKRGDVAPKRAEG
jgi:hypothetical protein